MESPHRSPRARTIFWTLAVIGLLAALTWYRAKLGRAQWGPPDAAGETNAPGN